MTPSNWGGGWSKVTKLSTIFIVKPIPMTNMDWMYTWLPPKQEKPLIQLALLCCPLWTSAQTTWTKWKQLVSWKGFLMLLLQWLWAVPKNCQRKMGGISALVSLTQKSLVKGKRFIHGDWKASHTTSSTVLPSVDFICAWTKALKLVSC